MGHWAAYHERTLLLRRIDRMRDGACRFALVWLAHGGRAEMDGLRKAVTVAETTEAMLAADQAEAERHNEEMNAR